MYLIQPQFLGSFFLDCLTAKSLLILVNKSLPYSFAGTLYQHQLYFLVSDVLLDRPKLSSRERKYHSCLLLLSPCVRLCRGDTQPIMLIFPHFLDICGDVFFLTCLPYPLLHVVFIDSIFRCEFLLPSSQWDFSASIFL